MDMWTTCIASCRTYPQVQRQQQKTVFDLIQEKERRARHYI
jgi:hypothetical protein